MSKIPVALIGAGRWGLNILRVLKELEREGLVRVEAVVDINEERVREVAKRFNVSNYLTDYSDLSPLGIKAAFIAVPIDKLVSIAKYLITVGIHVFVEKPVALNPDDIMELEKTSQTSKVVVQPGFIVRFDPVSHELRRLITVYGQPKYIIFKRLSRRPKRMRKYPVVFDLTIHDIDLTQFLLGVKTWKLESITVLEIENSTTQTLSASLIYGGTLVSYITDGNLPVKIREVNIGFNDVYVSADYVTRTVIIKGMNVNKVYKVEGEEPLKRELRAFITRVRGGVVDEAPTLRDAYYAVKIASSIFMREPEAVLSKISF